MRPPPPRRRPPSPCRRVAPTGPDSPTTRPSGTSSARAGGPGPRGCPPAARRRRGRRPGVRPWVGSSPGSVWCCPRARSRCATTTATIGSGPTAPSPTWPEPARTSSLTPCSSWTLSPRRTRTRGPRTTSMTSMSQMVPPRRTRRSSTSDLGPRAPAGSSTATPAMASCGWACAPPWRRSSRPPACAAPTSTPCPMRWPRTPVRARSGCASSPRPMSPSPLWCPPPASRSGCRPARPPRRSTPAWPRPPASCA